MEGALPGQGVCLVEMVPPVSALKGSEGSIWVSAPISSGAMTWNSDHPCSTALVGARESLLPSRLRVRLSYVFTRKVTVLDPNEIRNSCPPCIPALLALMHYSQARYGPAGKTSPLSPGRAGSRPSTRREELLRLRCGNGHRCPVRVDWSEWRGVLPTAVDWRHRRRSLSCPALSASVRLGIPSALFGETGRPAAA